MALERHDIAGLIDGYLDGELDAAQLAELSAWLEADRRHRDLFARAVMAQRAARDLMVSQVQLDAIGEPLPGLEMSRLIDDEVWHEVLDDAMKARRRWEVEDEANAMLNHDLAEQRRLRRWAQPQTEPAGPKVVVIPRVVVWGGLLAAVIALAGLIYINQPAPPASSTTPPGPTADTPDRGRAVPTAATVAHVRDSADAVWTATPLGGVVRAGDELTLRSGLARLTMLDGTSVVVQGPARLRAVADNALFLHEGQLTARSAPGEVGFRVETTVGQVTDLGTEFGVVLDPMGRLQAHVFDGEVSVAPANASARPGPGRRLVVGQAAAVTPSGTIHTAPADVVAFVRQEEFEARRDAETSPAARWLAHRYAVQRMQGLVAYYPMDEASVQAGRVLNAAPHTGAALDGRLGDARYQADAPRWVPGRVEGKRALAFDGTRRLVVIDDNDALDHLPAIAIAAWVRPDYDATRAPVLSILGKRESINGRIAFQLHLLSPYYPGSSYPPRSIQFATALNGNSNNRDVSTHSVSDPRLPGSGQWLHVVAMGDRDRTRFYINGRLAGETDGLLNIDNNAPLILGGTDVSGNTSAPHRSLQHFVGLIDEVILFDRLLTEAEVAQLYAGAP